MKLQTPPLSPGNFALDRHPSQTLPPSVPREMPVCPGLARGAGVRVSFERAGTTGLSSSFVISWCVTSFDCTLYGSYSAQHCRRHHLI